VNANRVYEFFGYQHAIPLWDNEIIEFFRVLPLEYKLNSYFFEKVIIDDIFGPLNIGYKKVAKKKNVIKDLVKKFIPSRLKKKIIATKIAFEFTDINKLSLRATPLLKEIKENIHYRNGNLIIAKWYILKVNGK